MITSPQVGSGRLRGAHLFFMNQNLCANNYLGLADHPDLITAAKDRWTRRVSAWPRALYLRHTDIHRRVRAKACRVSGANN